MEQRQLGRSGLVVSRLALGTMTWGRDTDEVDAGLQLADFRDAGGTFVDTAARYTGGESERILGRLLAETDRESLVIATKAGSAPEGPDCSRRTLLTSLETSLQRLQTDYIDLWQLHAWDPITPLDETLSALDAAVTSGKVRYVGISNYSGWQTAKAATYQASWPGRAALVSTQMEYSLLARGIEREVVAAADDLGLGLLPWSPLGRGVLTGKYREGIPADSRGAAEDYQRFVRAYLDEGSARIVDALLTAADGLGVSPIAVALAWVRDRPGVVAPIVGARTPAQLAGSLEAEDVELPEEIRSALDDVSEPDADYPERAPRWG
ncbi:aldo/keto reductase [Acidothermaceae bacterium B102]|nr:aldo/keto reductase [Acidothermaceae bacterium B102]